MVFLKLELRTIAVLLLLQSQQPLMSQNKAVVVDNTTKKAIPYVSIYTQKGKEIIGSSSDGSGNFIINFSFDELYFKHINYEEARVGKEDITDSVFLYPKTNMLSEVVVSGGQQKWIRELLLEVARSRKGNYNPGEQSFRYDYETRSLSQSSGYAFSSEGHVKIPNLLWDEKSSIAPEIAIIKYKDTTAGCDFSHLQKILYDHNLIQEFSKSFIKDYTFNLKSDTEDKDLVTFYFESKKYEDDRGYITIDSVSKAIVEYHRISGTDFNLKAGTSYLNRTFASKALGYNYRDLRSEIFVKYQESNGYYQLSETVLRGNVSLAKEHKDGREEVNTSSTESRLRLKPVEIPADMQWIILPKPFYIGIETREARLAYEALQNTPKKYEEFSIEN